MTYEAGKITIEGAGEFDGSFKSYGDKRAKVECRHELKKDTILTAGGRRWRVIAVKTQNIPNGGGKYSYADLLPAQEETPKAEQKAASTQAPMPNSYAKLDDKS